MIKDDGSAVVGNYEPRINQMYITPKEELINPEYSSFVNKYKVGTGYDNLNYTSLNEYQLELTNKVNELMKNIVLLIVIRDMLIWVIFQLYLNLKI